MKKIDLTKYNIISNIRQKLNEYGIIINDEYKIEKGDEFVFETNDVIIFVQYKKNTFGVLFPITSLPHVVANNMLILSELKDIKKIYIIESFTVTEDKTVLYGKEAFDHMINQFGKTIAEKNRAEDFHENLFKTMNWDLCPKC